VIVTAAIYADVERVGDVFTGEAGGIQPVKVYISMLADYDEQRPLFLPSHAAAKNADHFPECRSPSTCQKSTARTFSGTQI